MTITINIICILMPITGVESLHWDSLETSHDLLHLGKYITVYIHNDFDQATFNAYLPNPVPKIPSFHSVTKRGSASLQTKSSRSNKELSAERNRGVGFPTTTFFFVHREKFTAKPARIDSKLLSTIGWSVLPCCGDLASLPDRHSPTRWRLNL